MKAKLFSSAAVASVLLASSAHAVTVGLTGLANSPLGLITSGGAAVSGDALFVTSATQFTATDFDTAFAGISDAAAFALAVDGLAADLGVVRTASFTGGTLVSTGATELGAVGGNVYMFLVSEEGGFAYGAYQNVNDVPSLGAVTFNPTNSNDFAGHGTSVFAAGTPNSGFQLNVIPEPSIALLGSLGILGLLRRRR